MDSMLPFGILAEPDSIETQVPIVRFPAIAQNHRKFAAVSCGLFTTNCVPLFAWRILPKKRPVRANEESVKRYG